MRIRTICPSCKKTFTVDQSHIGQRVQCKSCQKRFLIAQFVDPPADDLSDFTVAFHPATQAKRNNLLARLNDLSSESKKQVAVGFTMAIIFATIFMLRWIGDDELVGIYLQLVAWTCVVAIGLGLYFIPAVIARKRRHPNIASILILNAFLGWTFLGWIAALVWATISLDATSKNKPIL